MKFFILVLIFSECLFAQVTVPENIGFITIQRILDKSDLGRADKKELEISLKEAKQEMLKMQSDLKFSKQNLNSQLSVLNKSAKAAKIKEIREKELEIVKFNQKTQKEINLAHQKRISEILDNIQEISEDLADDKELDYVISDLKGSVTYAKARIDLTTEVLQILNEDY